MISIAVRSEEVESGYLKISEHPLRYPPINTQFRRIRISRFPYLIVYEVEGNSVISEACKKKTEILNCKCKAVSFDSAFLFTRLRCRTKLF